MNHDSEKFDTLIVGGGPAGLSCAIHLSWHQHKVLVLDRRSGPLFFTLTQLENVPGLPSVSGVELQRTLSKQATELGATIRRSNIVSARGEVGNFELLADDGSIFRGQTLVLATGVARYHPTVEGDYRQCLAYAGKGNVFYCPDCEAPEIANKSTLIIGLSTLRGAIGTAKQLYGHSNQLKILLTGETPYNPEEAAWANEHQIEVIAGKIKQFVGRKGQLNALLLEDGRVLELQAYFVVGPKIPRNDLAQQLGIPITKTGHAELKSQRGDTAIEGVWIAGDLRPITQQVAVALGTGNLAAVQIDQYLHQQTFSKPD